MQENFTILNQRAALERPTFPVNSLLFWVPEPCLAAILDCRMIHGIFWVLPKAFFEWPSAQEGRSSTVFNNSTNLASSSQELRPDTTETTKRRERVKWKENRWIRESFTPFPKWKWCVKSNWSNLFSQWYAGLSETSDFGNASWEITWLYGISKLENRRQEWGMQEQRILRSLCTESKKLRLQNQLTNLWHRDWLWGERISLTSICLMRWLRLHCCEEDKLRTWSMNISVLSEPMKQYKDCQICSL